MHTEFVGEMEVYYSPDDDYIYMEVGAIGWDYKKAKVREVNREGDSYIITYDLYSDFSDMLAPYSTVDVTIVESDNKYGYSLVSVVAIKWLSGERWRASVTIGYALGKKVSTDRSIQVRSIQKWMRYLKLLIS